MPATKQIGTTMFNQFPAGRYQYYMVFDTETTMDERQDLRFGVYEIHWNTDKMLSHGLFYNPDTMSPDEITTLREYASENCMASMNVADFIKLFYNFAHRRDIYTCVIGHNLPFDLSRLAKEWQFPQKDFENGFSLKLCSCTWNRKKQKRSFGDSCKFHPSIRIKKISPKASIMEFLDRSPKGNFIDTATLARALLGPGSTTLDSLGKVLDIEHKKMADDIQHGQTLTEEYLDYACRDVQATWEIYTKLREIYASYNFRQKSHYIFSEASLGKSLYKELGITPPMSRMQDLPSEIHGYAMAAYYGGRAEVHMRHKECQIAYCDFKSEYPTVFSLMGLQDMLLAESYQIEDVTAWVNMALDFFKLDDLQDSSVWRNLRVLCKVSGNNLVLPIRAKFNGQSTNIALCNTALKGTWYTLADVLANMLLGGEKPCIEQAIEVFPRGRIETKPLAMFDGLVTIDPNQNNIFTTLINQRSRIKKQAEKATGPEKEKLDRTQLALKLLANSTSYGINIELRAENCNDDLIIYGNDGAMQAASSEMQVPGVYYCPVIGTHIPAGGRLLLAIAQRLASDHGLTYAMCDTDSMCFVKPPDMSDKDFYVHVDTIINWFKPLYPYDDGGELFELEKVNFWQGAREPLYFLGVSAKRYVLYNKGLGTRRLRKVSSHGLGAFRVSDTYKSPAWIPEPEVSLKDLELTQHTRWIYDLWYEYATLFTAYGPSAAMVEPMWERPAIDTPAFQQVTVSTAYLYKLFSQVEGIKPFNFVTTFFAFSPKQLEQRIAAYPMLQDEYEKCTSSLYVPYTSDVHNLKSFYVIKSNELVTWIHPLTVAEAIAGYFDHPEYKSANGFLDGEMHMRNVEITGWIPQGKESSYEVLELEDAGLPETLAREAIDMEYMTCAQWESLKERIREQGINMLAKKLGIAQPRLSEILASPRPPKRAMLQQLKSLL